MPAQVWPAGLAEYLFKKVGKFLPHLKLKFMRKYLLGLFAVVMAVSLSAFTSAKSSKETGKSADLYWFLYDATTGTTGAYLAFGEKKTFRVPTCNKETQIDCRRGYSETDLVDPDDPNQGVISSNAHDDQIRKL
jgi:hypothetical protein